MSYSKKMSFRIESPNRRYRLTIQCRSYEAYIHNHKGNRLSLSLALFFSFINWAKSLYPCALYRASILRLRFFSLLSLLIWISIHNSWRQQQQIVRSVRKRHRMEKEGESWKYSLVLHLTNGWRSEYSEFAWMFSIQRGVCALWIEFYCFMIKKGRKRAAATRCIHRAIISKGLTIILFSFSPIISMKYIG